jgi:hypothetical protein
LKMKAAGFSKSWHMSAQYMVSHSSQPWLDFRNPYFVFINDLFKDVFVTSDHLTSVIWSSSFRRLHRLQYNHYTMHSRFLWNVGKLNFPTFRRNVLLLAVGWLNLVGLMLKQYSHPEHEDIRFFRNIGTLNHFTVHKPNIRPSSDQQPPW